MNLVHQCAVRDARSDYADRQRTDAEWLTYCDRVRSGDVFGPALLALEAGGVETLCRSWGITVDDWNQRSADWVRKYNGFYCCVIEFMARGPAGATS